MEHRDAIVRWLLRSKGRVVQLAMQTLFSPHAKYPMFLRRLAPPLKALLFGPSPEPRAAVFLGDLVLWVSKDEYHSFARGWEPLTSQFFTQSLHSGITVVDVGAHCGYYTLLAASLVGPNGKVYAVEPAPRNFKLLRDNVTANNLSNVSLINAAAGAFRGRRVLLLGDTPMRSGLHGHPTSAIRGEVTVDCAPLDDILADAHVDVVKIDVEGSELEVLAGMRRILAINSDLQVFIEFNPPCLRQAGLVPHALPQRLWDLGFQTFLVDDKERTTTLLSPDNYSALVPEHDEHWYVNLYCHRDTNAL